ncbi:MAG: UvrD-helicase domain-containing protein, partial [Fenollaria timonensis]
MKLNEKQQLAVDTIDKNVLLDASAGTGKTTVLVNRFVNILDKGDFSRIRPDEVLSSIVAITFTKKASNELK